MLNSALTYLLERSPFAGGLDGTRLAAMGHSSGGASVLMLAGVAFSAADLAAYWASGAGAADIRAAQYPAGDDERTRQPPVAYPAASERWSCSIPRSVRDSRKAHFGRSRFQRW